MRESLDLGKRGEDVALEYLVGKGMEFLCRNVRASHKEVDLIFMQGNFIRFVEVKSRSYPNLASPIENMSIKKQRNLIRAAQKMVSKGFLMCNGKKFDLTGKEVVFDVVLVIFNGDYYKLNYLQNAFTPYW